MARETPRFGVVGLGAFGETDIGCLRSGRLPEPAPLDDVRHGLAVALAVIQAAEEGQTVAPATARTG